MPSRGRYDLIVHQAEFAGEEGHPRLASVAVPQAGSGLLLPVSTNGDVRDDILRVMVKQCSLAEAPSAPMAHPEQLSPTDQLAQQPTPHLALVKHDADNLADTSQTRPGRFRIDGQTNRRF